MSMPPLLLQAVELARRSLHRGQRKKAYIACVGRRGDGTIVRATNGRVLDRRPAAHAEVRCVRKMDRGSVVHVARVLRDGSIAMARPCEDCVRYLAARGVLEIYYTKRGGGWDTIEKP